VQFVAVPQPQLSRLYAAGLLVGSSKLSDISLQKVTITSVVYHP